MTRRSWLVLVFGGLGFLAVSLTMDLAGGAPDWVNPMPLFALVVTLAAFYRTDGKYRGPEGRPLVMRTLGLAAMFVLATAGVTAALYLFGSATWYRWVVPGLMTAVIVPPIQYVVWCRETRMHAAREPHNSEPVGAQTGLATQA